MGERRTPGAQRFWSLSTSSEFFLGLAVLAVLIMVTTEAERRLGSYVAGAGVLVAVAAVLVGRRFARRVPRWFAALSAAVAWLLLFWVAGGVRL